MDNRQWTTAIVAAFALLNTIPFVVAATRDEFWRGLAPIAALLIFGVVVALVRRRRWAWIVLLVTETAVLVSFAFDFTGALPFVLNGLSLLLLVTPQMREYVRPRTI